MIKVTNFEILTMVPAGHVGIARALHILNHAGYTVELISYEHWSKLRLIHDHSPGADVMIFKSSVRESLITASLLALLQTVEEGKPDARLAVAAYAVQADPIRITPSMFALAKVNEGFQAKLIAEIMNRDEGTEALIPLIRSLCDVSKDEHLEGVNMSLTDKAIKALTDV